MDNNFETLYEWIKEHTTSCSKSNISGNINHDFSNAILLVEILHKHFPKLVELQNYSPKNTFAQKLINWQTLNTKFLNKINIYLSQLKMEQLADGKPGIVEKLLQEIKNKINIKSGNEENEILSLERQPSIKQEIEEATEEKVVILQESFDKLRANLAEKNEKITTLKKKRDRLQNRLNYLANLFKITDRRHEDLTFLLQNLQDYAAIPSVQGRRLLELTKLGLHITLLTLKTVMSSSDEEVFFDIDWEVAPCFDYQDQNLLSPLMVAIFNDNVEEIINLLKAGRSVNINDNRGNTPLHLSVTLEKRQAFDYIIQVEDIRLDVANFESDTPLSISTQTTDDYYFKELLRRGCSVNWRSLTGDTLLHKTLNSKIAKVLIEHGIDINAVNDYNQTALHLACQNMNYDLVYMYIYFGADVTIMSDKGFLPFDIALGNFPEDIQESLFYLTYDKDSKVSFTSLMKTIINMSPFFYEIVKYTKNIVYTWKDIQQCYQQFPFYTYEIIKFEETVKDQNIEVCYFKKSKHLSPEKLTFRDFSFLLCDFFYHHYDNKFYCSYILALDIALDPATKLICCALSYGHSIKSSDLNLIYYRYGFCELFRILLHIAEINTSDELFESDIMPILICDVTVNIDILNSFEENEISQDALKQLLNFFNLSKFKEKFPTFCNELKLNELSQVPSLVELSRNVARAYIISRFKITDNVRFFTVIRNLPVCEILKKIITYEKEIYYCADV